MTAPVDVSTLPVPAQKILDPKAPAPLRQMAAKGIAPGLKPADAITVVVMLSLSGDESVANVASETLAKLPKPLLNGALTAELHPAILDVVAPLYAEVMEVMEKVIALPQILGTTVATIASKATEQVAELVATNEERLLANPIIIEALYMNRATRMSTADRLIELAARNNVELTGIPAYKEAVAAIQNELIPEASAEPTPDDVLFKEVSELSSQLEIDPTKEDTHKLNEDTGEEEVEEKFLPLFARVGKMSISQRIRLAMLGTASERMLLVRDKNKLVASAAIRSPKTQENDVILVSSLRNVAEEVLRIISTSGEWTKSHQIKWNLVSNPRTPFMQTSKLMPHLREHELKLLQKSKNVPGNVSTLARQTLSRRKKD
ncbi:MAG: hypothetical protein U0169_18605 [Polyangiaceae bacterium]